MRCDDSFGAQPGELGDLVEVRTLIDRVDRRLGWRRAEVVGRASECPRLRDAPLRLAHPIRPAWQVELDHERFRARDDVHLAGERTPQQGAVQAEHRVEIRQRHP